MDRTGDIDCDVLVIGAGLAGLQCARHLAGRAQVSLVEAGDDIGGRVRTDVVDGFRLDRGFQLLNPAYPMVATQVDVDALGLRTFEPGVAVRGAQGIAIVLDPRRRPRSVLASLRTGYLGARDVAAVARFAGPVLLAPQRALNRPDNTLGEAMDAAGLTGRLRREVIDPFLAGVLLTEDATTSANFVRLLVRAFALGAPGLPTQGMSALPHQLQTHLSEPATLGRQARQVSRHGTGWRTTFEDGHVSSRAVVVATDPATAHRLTGIPVPTMNGVLTWWFAVDEPPRGHGGTDVTRLLLVDGRRAGPVVNTTVISDVAPAYAPVGKHLVQASVLWPPGAEQATEADVRTHLAQLWDADVARWEVVRVNEIRDALPAQPVPLQVRRPVAQGHGLFVCGDHRDTASIQGAMVSGTRTATAVRDYLRAAG